MVALVEAAKTAHIGAILMPEMVWLSTEGIMGLTAERLRPLKGREVILFPDEGKGYELWSERIRGIAEEVGFSYKISVWVEDNIPSQGDDIVDIIQREADDECPF